MKRILFTMMLTTALTVPVIANAETVVRVNEDRTETQVFNPGTWPIFREDEGYTSQYRIETIRADRMGRIDHSALDRTLVQAVQQELSDAYYYRSGVDGVWDAPTEMALAGFQGSEGLMPTGDLDRETLLRLGIVMPAADQVASQSRPLANQEESAPVYVVTERRSIDYIDNRDSGAIAYNNLNEGEVQAVQQALTNGGFYTAGVDGDWGPRTTEGLRDFQVANGIMPTGRLNSETVAELGLQVSDANQISAIEPAAGDKRHYSPRYVGPEDDMR